MTPLDLKRKQVELLRVSSAKADIELRIQERLEEVERLKEHVAISEAKEVDLSKSIEDIQKELSKS